MPIYGGGIGSGNTTITSTGVLNVRPTSIPSQWHAKPPAAINIGGFAGMTEASDLLIALNTAQTGFSRINWDGSFQIAADNTTATHLLEVGDQANNVLIVSTSAPEAAVAIQGTDTDAVVLDFRGVSGQTEPLLYASVPSGGVFFILPAGAHVFKAAVPTDASVPTGYCALWFDSTNGAAKLMIKAKQNDGTVRTGSVALT